MEPKKSFRSLRKKSGLSLRRVARIMGISAPYLSDLELGNRAWSAAREQQFRNAVNPKQKGIP